MMIPKQTPNKFKFKFKGLQFHAAAMEKQSLSQGPGHEDMRRRARQHHLRLLRGRPPQKAAVVRRTAAAARAPRGAQGGARAQRQRDVASSWMYEVS